MRTPTIAAAAALTFLLAAPGQAFHIDATAISAGNPSDAQDNDGAEDAAEEKKVCRRVTMTGSRLGERVCKTKAEWEASRKENSRAVRQSRNEE